MLFGVLGEKTADGLIGSPWKHCRLFNARSEMATLSKVNCSSNNNNNKQLFLNYLLLFIILLIAHMTHIVYTVESTVFRH